MNKKNQTYRPPTHDEIAEYAFYLWDAEGRRSDQDIKYWLEAEAHLLAVRRHEAGLLKPAKAPPSIRRTKGIATPSPERPRTYNRPASPL